MTMRRYRLRAECSFRVRSAYPSDVRPTSSSRIDPMRSLLTLALFAGLSLGACGGGTHTKSIASASNPPAPVNPPDPGSAGGGNTGGGNGSETGGSTTGGGTSGGGASGGGASGGGTSGGGTSGGGTSGGGTSGGGTSGGGTSGGGGGQPVPEPSTFVLVGTGLAGLSLLRRRRKSQDQIA